MHVWCWSFRCNGADYHTAWSWRKRNLVSLLPTNLSYHLIWKYLHWKMVVSYILSNILRWMLRYIAIYTNIYIKMNMMVIYLLSLNWCCLFIFWALTCWRYHLIWHVKSYIINHNQSSIEVHWKQILAWKLNLFLFPLLAHLI